MPLKIYANGTVFFRYDNGSISVIRISEFIRIVRSLDGWSVGERAMKNNSEGTILKMYANGTVLFVYDEGSSSIHRISDLVHIVRSLNGWSVGQRALLNNSSGTITRIYANGSVLFAFDNGSMSFADISRLTRNK